MVSRPLLATLVVVACLCLNMAVATTTPSDRTLLLNAHNAARARMPATEMPTMVWDSTLEEVAQTYSDKCAYGHNGARYTDYVNAGGTKFTSVGENIAASASSTNDRTTQGTMQGWFQEEDFWTYPMTCQAGKVCGHWTQIIWANSTAVGCGVSSCPGIISGYAYGLYVVCNYGPAGNFGGSNPFHLDRSNPASNEPEFTPGSDSASHFSYRIFFVISAFIAIVAHLAL